MFLVSVYILKYNTKSVLRHNQKLLEVGKVTIILYALHIENLLGILKHVFWHS